MESAHSNGPRQISNLLDTRSTARVLQISYADDRERTLLSNSQVTKLVQEGYDTIAPRYLEWSTPSLARLSYLDHLLACLPKAATVLELGCGSGKPCTQILAEHAEVTGVDISATQLAFAKQLVPKAHFIQADMMSLNFPRNSYDAIVAFYSIIHIPRMEHNTLIRRIAGWLRPGGLLLLNMGTTDDAESIDQDWLGGKMYWSSYNVQKSESMLLGAGFKLLKAEVIEDNEDGKLVPFYWVFAKIVDGSEN